MATEPQVLESFSSNSTLYHNVTSYFYEPHVDPRLARNGNALTLNFRVRDRTLTWRAKPLPVHDGAVLVHELPMELAADADKCRVDIENVVHKWFLGDIEIDNAPTLKGVLLQFHGYTCKFTVSFFQDYGMRIRLVDYGFLLKQRPSLSAGTIATRAVHHIFTRLVGMLPGVVG